jgi:outer membrane protein
MKKQVFAIALMTLGMAAGNAMAEQSPWLLRARAVNIDPANQASPVGGTGAADRISVSKKTIAEFDVTYYFTPNCSAELVLTYPQRHDVALDGGKIGTFKHLPPTLLVQHHFQPAESFSPYLGAGVNYTTMSKVDLLGGKGGLDHSSVGFAVQAGLDVKLDKNWSFNLDVKKVQIRSDVTLSGAKISNIKVDPVLLGVGLGYRF